MDAVSIRGDWVGQVIDGKFPLLEWLGGSGTGGVFRTELDGSRRAAIKVILASAQAEERLSGWPAAASLSHPHLLRILHYGRAEIQEAKLIYVVTDFAEEVLAQIIPDRPLSADETREMLAPVLDALQYIHDKNYVHGHLKPANILVVDDDIKLSSDSLIPPGNLSPDLPGNDIHTAPEAGHGPVSRSADVWSLGITMVEALTQEPPIWDAADKGDPIVSSSVPAPFAVIARECLHRDPSRRCTLPEVRAMLEGRQVQRATPPPPPHLPHHTQRLADKPLQAKIPLLPLIIGFVLLLAIIIGLQMHSRKAQTAPSQSETAQQTPTAESDSQSPKTEPESAPTATSPPKTASPAAPAATGASPGNVVSRALPEVSRQASNTIHGTVGVAVRVNVDTSGAVTEADFDKRGPSAYFARLALESAHNWKFTPPQQNGRAVASTWLLHYAFRRDGVDARPEQTAP